MTKKQFDKKKCKNMMVINYKPLNDIIEPFPCHILDRLSLLQSLQILNVSHNLIINKDSKLVKGKEGRLT